MGIDNILITGTAVPEPSTYALIIGFIAFLFVAIKRRS
ncbi:MAG: PEP-CTERM sorting domain-containing protein [Opitutales bacterium]